MAALLLSKCAQFRENEEFIDVRLKVGEQVFPAHRNVLAANSDYFYAMFTDGMRESDQEVIELKDKNISAASLKIVIDSIYSGDVLIHKENVFEVLTTASHLQVTSVVRQCCDFLDKEFIQRSFDVRTYRQLSAFADLQGLRDLQEATQRKMALMYKEVCESEEFLTNIDAAQLSSLLSRDDLSAPSETFVFKSVMQWIQYKKEERMSVAAKVIGAVRLGLVDIKDVIRELSTEGMKQVPEVQVLVCEALLHNNMPSPNSKFAVEKTKPRSMSPVLVAVFPGWSNSAVSDLALLLGIDSYNDSDDEQRRPKTEDFVATQMMYFDADTKSWKKFPSMARLADATKCFCTEVVGNYLYVAARESGSCVIYRYNTVSNIWDTLPPFRHQFNPIKCLCSVDEYIFAFSDSDLPQRYSLAQNDWQSGSKLPFLDKSTKEDKLIGVTAVVMNPKIYALHGYYREVLEGRNLSLKAEAAVVHCFDPQKNEWKQMASTIYPHFGSSLLVDNNKLYVAGGRISVSPDYNHKRRKIIPAGDGAPVEVYNEAHKKWSVVAQKHIPPNNLSAVELRGGRVYFIINKFPIDSGIRIPPEEMYHISFSEWENLRHISKNAVLCHLTVKKDILKTFQVKAKSPARSKTKRK